jgi:hypothetical protein
MLKSQEQQFERKEEGVDPLTFLYWLSVTDAE